MVDKQLQAMPPKPSPSSIPHAQATPAKKACINPAPAKVAPNLAQMLECISKKWPGIETADPLTTAEGAPPPVQNGRLRHPGFGRAILQMLLLTPYK